MFNLYELSTVEKKKAFCFKEKNSHLKSHLFCNIGIKHNFPFINIRKVHREILKARGFQYLPKDLATVNE